MEQLMNKKIIVLILGIGLNSMVFAELGFYLSVNSNEDLKVFTNQYIIGQSPKPAFRDTLIMISSFEPNRQEFLFFGNIIKGENIAIEGGIWNTKKSTMGMGFGKVLTLPLSLPKMDIEFCLDFSAGPFAYLFLSNEYTHVSGPRTHEVEDASILKHVQYGLYSIIRLRLVHFKNYLNAMAVNLGFHFFMPFSEHEFSSDPKARYHLFKTFVFVGISF
jgi:hypothetical protein